MQDETDAKTHERPTAPYGSSGVWLPEALNHEDDCMCEFCDRLRRVQEGDE